MKMMAKSFLKYIVSILFVFSLTMFAFSQINSLVESRTIVVEKIQPIAAYANMTNELGSVLNVSGSIRLNTTAKEIAKLEKTNVSYVKVGKVYYRLTLYSSLVVRKLDASENHVKVKEVLFPSLRKLILSATQSGYDIDLNIPIEELLRIEEFVEENGSVIKYNGSFYRIIIDCRIYLKAKCYEVAEDDLEDKPKLRELLETAEKSGYAKDSTSLDEWRRIQYLVYKESGNLPLEYNGSCYRVRAIGAP